MPTIEVFFCYAREDKAFLQELEDHLAPLKRQGLITSWHDGDIRVGTEWEQEIKAHLDTAQLVLLLVSPSFMNSDYAYGTEMTHALERQGRSESRVIPVIVRPVYWQGEPLGKLQALPADGKPVTSWSNRDEAFHNVVEGIRAVKGAIRALVVGPDGQMLISGSEDRTIKAWNIQSGKLLRTLEGHDQPIQVLLLSSDGQTLLSAGKDNTIGLWNLQQEKPLRMIKLPLENQPSIIHTAMITSDGKLLIASIDDKTIKIWGNK